VNGRVVFSSSRNVSVALNKRNFGMVFQSYAIWPHMTVFENAAYPLRVSRGRRYTSAQIENRVMAVLDKVGLADYAQRPAPQLSGGQQQRLALARALTREPRLLLLDEPLSNLDAQLREQMRVELKRLQQETGVTTVYVTHDQAEALAISDRIAVMHEGKIAQIGAPKDIYGRPASEFVANFIGRTNLLRGTLLADAPAESIARVHTPMGELSCFFPRAFAGGAAVALVIRPEHIAIAKVEGALGASRETNRLTGEILHEIYLGEIVEYLVRIADGEILVRTPFGTVAKGDMVTLCFPAERTVVLSQS